MRAILWDDATQGMTFSYAPVPVSCWQPPGSGGKKWSQRRRKPSDELMDKYLETGDLSEAEIVAGLRKRTVAGEIQPVLCGSAFRTKASSGCSMRSLN
ncbi:Elongation factor G [Raoultella terrigena]|uniref:Elongation factor G n=1 Tax=Raoultella terrigena TaxID=577 RepID=A0A4U9CZE3_RAOTE|nr:Elongation factor G [Raoultella terrigena]